MAVDLTAKTLNVATRMQAAAVKVIEGLEEGAALLAEKESSGLNFTEPAFETALANSTMKHVSGDDLNSALTAFNTVKTYIETNFIDDVLQKLRP